MIKTMKKINMLKKIFLILTFILTASCAHAAITYGNFYFDGLLTTTNGVVDATPLVQVTATAPATPSFNSWAIYVDAVAQAIVPVYSGATTISFQFTNAMTVGAHQIVVQGHENGTTNSATLNIVVQAQAQQLVGSVAPYPSPATSNINFQYTLAETSDIVLSIFNISGQLIHQRRIFNPAEGAHAGLNTITWDLASGFDGRRVANGVYIGILTSSGKSQPLGRFKFMVLN
jgi:hypothetical protein